MNNIFPDFVNFYSIIESPSKIEIKNRFYNDSWKIRKESFYDFEIANEWAELNLIGENSNLILTGMISNPDVNYKVLINFMTEIDAKFTAELYDKNNLLLNKFSNIEL